MFKSEHLLPNFDRSSFPMLSLASPLDETERYDRNLALHLLYFCKSLIQRYVCDNLDDDLVYDFIRDAHRMLKNGRITRINVSNLIAWTNLPYVRLGRSIIVNFDGILTIKHSAKTDENIYSALTRLYEIRDETVYSFADLYRVEE